MQSVDLAILKFFVENRSEWLSLIFYGLSYLGNAKVVVLITALTIVIFLIKKHYKNVVSLLISVVGSSISVHLLKVLFIKERPLAEAFYFEPTFSFPSGHASIAAALYGFLIHWIWQHYKKPVKKLWIALLGILIVSLGISRLYLGVHYLSDVLAGYLVGALWLFISLRLQKKI